MYPSNHTVSLGELIDEIKEKILRDIGKKKAYARKRFTKPEIFANALTLTQWCVENDVKPMDFTSGMIHIYNQLSAINKETYHAI